MKYVNKIHIKFNLSLVGNQKQFKNASIGIELFSQPTYNNTRSNIQQ